MANINTNVANIKKNCKVKYFKGDIQVEAKNLIILLSFLNY